MIIKSEKKIKRMKNESEYLEKVEFEEIDFEPVELAKKTTSLKQDLGIFLLGLIILLIFISIIKKIITGLYKGYGKELK